MRRVPVLLCLALLGMLPLRAARALPPLTLTEVVARAVRENPALAAAGAQLAEADAALLAARGLDDPVLSARAEARRTRREAVPGQPVQERALDALAAGVSLSQPLPIGGRLGLHADGGYSHTRFETESADLGRSRLASEQYAPSLQLTLEQPLLRGAGVAVARADRRRAQSARNVAQAEREATATALVRDVVGAYWALAAAQAELEIRSASLSAARAQRGWVEAAIGVGKLPPSATAEVAVAIAEREDARLQAQQWLTERRLALVRAGALSLHEAAVVAALPALDTTTPELAALLALALAHNPQLQALAEQTQRAALELGLTENGLLPQLDLRVAGGPVGNAPSAHGAYEQLGGLSSYALTAQLALELPIGRHAARGAHEAASARVQRARLTAADVRAQLEVAVASGLAALESAQLRARILTPSLEAAALDLEAEQARFEVGRGSSFDVLRRQDALARLRLLLVSAQRDVQLAQVSLQAATGQLLERHGVVLRGAWN